MLQVSISFLLSLIFVTICVWLWRLVFYQGRSSKARQAKATTRWLAQRSFHSPIPIICGFILCFFIVSSLLAPVLSEVQISFAYAAKEKIFLFIFISLLTYINISSALRSSH